MFSESLAEYYRGNKLLPIYEHPKKRYTGEKIAQILCNPMLDEKLICCTHPVSVENNVFVVDLSTLKDRDDICADDLGAWKYTGSRVLTFSVKFSEMGCHVVNPNSKGAVVINVR